MIAGARRSRTRAIKPLCAGAARAARQGRQAQVVRRRRAVRARLPLRVALRRAARASTASPASRSPRPRPDRGRARRRHRQRRPRTTWCAACRCARRSRRSARSAARRPSSRPSSEQFRDALRELSDAEQDSKELKSAKRAALYERIETELQPAVPVAASTAGSTRSRAATRAARPTRSTSRSSARRSRSRSAAPTAARPRRSGRSRPRSAVTPRTHGSALFTRGQTQALTLVTLGTAKEEQRIDDLSLDTTKRYIHHYNFPPFSVGETGFMRGPKRRDIGHGALAERALVPVIPDAETFPYTMRVVSEILESNGSSSMASVCGSTLALMDAGVPINCAGGGHRDGPDQGGRQLRSCSPTSRAPRTTSATWTSRSRARPTASPPCRWTSRSRASPPTCCARRWRRRATLGCASSTSMAEALAEPRTELSAYAPQVRHDQDRVRPDRPHHRQGRRDDPRPRGGVRLSRSTSRRTASSASTPRAARCGEGCRERIEEMTRPISRRRRLPRPARSSRRPTSARSSSSARAPTACCTSRASRRACASTRSSRCSTAATS